MYQQMLDVILYEPLFIFKDQKTIVLRYISLHYRLKTRSPVQISNILNAFKVIIIDQKYI